MAHSAVSGPLLSGPAPPRPPVGTRKRLIVTCDGTWLNSDNGLVDGKLVIPSNVVRISWALKPISTDGISQIVYYQAGVGSTGGWIDRIVGGATGAGLAERVQAAYHFLAVNYSPGDEIFLLGFSRGAFTARSVGGLIDGLGLLTRRGLPSISEVIEDFQHRHNPNYRPRYPDVPFPDKPSASDPAYREELQRRGLTRLDIPIKAIGVWDTVGSLGIPRIPILERLHLQPPSMKEYTFYDTALGLCVENGFQALALDEHREPFGPAVWEKPRGSNTNLYQVWFPGVHSNVGGGYADQELANITLTWMISRLEPFLDFHHDFILQQYDLTRRYYRQKHESTRPWSFGKIYNSAMGIYGLAGSKTRTPGAYHRVDPFNGRPTSKLLRDTHEYIHPCVRSRLGLGGPGVEDHGAYECRALKDWDFTVQGGRGEASPGPAGGRLRVLWRKKAETDDGGQMEMPESTLLPSEIVLLEQNKKIEDYVMNMARAKPSKSSRRRSKR